MDNFMLVLYSYRLILGAGPDHDRPIAFHSMARPLHGWPADTDLPQVPVMLFTVESYRKHRFFIELSMEHAFRALF